jgi:hypothetical protein
LSRVFGGGTFSDDELLRYLKFLDTENRIEDDIDSDNKAREIVRRWKRGDPRFELTVDRKVLLIQEMLSGFTGDDYERAILEILAGARDAEIPIILNKVSEDELRSNFHGDESDELDQFLATWRTHRERASRSDPSRSGRKAIIDLIVVDQETTQTVTAHYTDGRELTDICSAGKGGCCLEPDARGPAWSAADSRENNSARTPVGRFKVEQKIPDNRGIKWWTEFEDPRDIALHQYWPVDGTPLSHGCVRLHGDTAKAIFEGSVEHKTVVEVRKLPTPRCNHPALQREWAGDFRTAGTPPDGEKPDVRREIAHTRAFLTRSLRLSERDLDAKIAELTAAPGGLGALDSVGAAIPRCRTP